MSCNCGNIIFIIIYHGSQNYQTSHRHIDSIIRTVQMIICQDIKIISQLQIEVTEENIQNEL